MLSSGTRKGHSISYSAMHETLLVSWWTWPQPRFMDHLIQWPVGVSNAPDGRLACLTSETRLKSIQKEVEGKNMAHRRALVPETRQFAIGLGPYILGAAEICALCGHEDAKLSNHEESGRSKTSHLSIPFGFAFVT
jgi:hypothetical protein